MKKTTKSSFTYDTHDGETVTIDLSDVEPISITAGGFDYTFDTMYTDNTSGTITVDPLDMNTFSLGMNGITGYDFKSKQSASLTLGNTSIDEKTLEKLLALLKFIESLGDDDEFKKGFNVFRAMDRLQK